MSERRGNVDDVTAATTSGHAFEYVPAADLVPYPGNPRRGDEERVRESIRENGFFGALVVRRSTREILVGNHRYRAGVAEGMASFPVTWVDVDDARARKILLADNRTGDLAAYDEASLAEVLRQVAADAGGGPDALVGTGYAQADVDAIVAAAIPPAEPAPPAEFQKYDEDVPTEHRCPKCGYEWSGAASAGKK